MISINLLKYTTNLIKDCLISHKTILQSQCLTMSSLSSNTSKERNTKCAQNLVIDLSFEDLMTTEECHRLARDLYSIHCINSSLNCNETQFKVNICDQLSENSITIEYLRQYLPQIQTLNNFRIHNKTYLQLFSPERLVYLSPDAKQHIKYNSNDIYIIGGIVEKNVFRKDSNRMTYLKAKREGIRVGRFPIDHFISDDMKRGIVLFLPQVFGILSDVKSTQDWESAVRRHLPLWKLKPLERQKTYQCQ